MTVPVTQLAPPSPGAVDRFLAALVRSLPSDALGTDPETRARYGQDESEVPPTDPCGVVFARSAADVAATLRLATHHGVPVTPRAAGTSRVGGAVPVDGGLVLSLEGMNDLRGIEGPDLYAVVDPGLVTKRFQEAASAEGLFYGPDPSSWNECTLGGNIAANAGGPRAFKYGVTRDWVLGLEVVLASGETIEVGRRTRKGVTGYDLTALLVGSEGTLGVITGATLRLVPEPEVVVTVLAALESEADIGPAIDAALGRGVFPRCVELLDAETLPVVRPESAVPIPHDAEALLILEIDGSEQDVGAPTQRLVDALESAGAVDVQVATDPEAREALWSARRKMSRTLRTLATHKMSEDVVVPRARVADLLREVRRISRETSIRMPAYGHAGDGNLHVNFLWNDGDERARVDRGIDALFRAVIGMGGTLSGEHGLGVLKAPYLPLEQRPAVIDLQERVKATFDPAGILNPGKVFPASASRWHGAC